ncbi:hypothetical protein BGZ80_003629 [Entomortierella chlamydospora]|uniref:F-box domain-containing protein n=1 Tax=Entomortierella chlamydospora TaxID=101097 RepID=A0A9P6MNQ6_9FUNG|nr:hypothetical protein BGZ80_003629 [Entomortierella chlamydospora]
MSTLITLDPVELPEIRGLIVKYLSKRDLAQCIRASHSWNTLFIPYIWEQVDLNEQLIRRGFNLESLTPYSHLVKSISVTDVLEFSSLVSACPNLQSLQVTMPSFGLLRTYQQTLRNQLSAILTDTLSIVRLVMDSVYVEWSLITMLKNLKELKLSNCDTMIQSSVGDFWNRDHPQLESLSLSFVHIPDLWEETEQSASIYPIFPNVKSLEIERLTTLPEGIQVEIIRQCPNLETLRFLAYFRERIQSSLPNEIVRLAAIESWPKLRNLHYNGPILSGQGSADILRSMELCYQWDISYADFNIKSLQALGEHYSTLTRVNLTYCDSARSDMLQEILSSCPQLRKFRGVRIFAKDIVQGKPWVCSSLQTFMAFIDFGDKPEVTAEEAEEMGQSTISTLATLDDLDVKILQQAVFEALSHLNNLRNLSVGLELSINEGVREFRHGLDFKLGNGLELLEGLKDLEIIGVSNTFQDMGMEEIEWMLAHWRRLEQVMGTCCYRDKQTDLWLLRHLSSQGITVDYVS